MKKVLEQRKKINAEEEEFHLAKLLADQADKVPEFQHPGEDEKDDILF